MNIICYLNRNKYSGYLNLNLEVLLEWNVKNCGFAEYCGSYCGCTVLYVSYSECTVE